MADYRLVLGDFGDWLLAIGYWLLAIGYRRLGILLLYPRLNSRYVPVVQAAVGLLQTVVNESD